MQEVDDQRHVVVVNGEQQYSIWPHGRGLPHGWQPAGFEGPRADCLAYIARTWTDMRPLSVRRHLGECA